MTTDTNIGTPIIDATTIRVTPKDRPASEAKAEAVGDALAETHQSIADADADITALTNGCAITCVERYLEMGPLVIRAKSYGESQRATAEATGVAQSRLSRSKTLYESWPTGVDVSDAYATYSAGLKAGAHPTVDGFIRSVIGGVSKSQTPAQRLASAVRGCVKAGMTDEQIMEVVEATLAQ